MTIYDVQNAAKLSIWQERVRECRMSGMGVKPWCREHGLDFTTYYRWEKKVLEAAAVRQTVAVKKETEVSSLPAVASQPIIVKIEDSVPTAQIGAANTVQSPAGTVNSVNFTINGTCITVDEDISTRFLGKLVEAVKNGSR